MFAFDFVSGGQGAPPVFPEILETLLDRPKNKRTNVRKDITHGEPLTIHIDDLDF